MFPKYSYHTYCKISKIYTLKKFKYSPYNRKQSLWVFHNFWTNFVSSVHCVENKAAADTVTATWELLSVAFISWYKTWNQCQKCLNFLEKQRSELNYPFIQKPKFQILSLFLSFSFKQKVNFMLYYPTFISISS